MHIQLLYKLLPSFLCDSYKRWNNYQKNSILQQTIKCKESNSKWRVIDIKTLNNFLNEWLCVHRIMLSRFKQRMFYSSVKIKIIYNSIPIVLLNLAFKCKSDDFKYHTYVFIMHVNSLVTTFIFHVSSIYWYFILD